MEAPLALDKLLKEETEVPRNFPGNSRLQFTSSSGTSLGFVMFASADVLSSHDLLDRLQAGNEPRVSCATGDDFNGPLGTHATERIT